ncbi:hypothetical protein OPKNFCMD_1013 [Methylobacterium crusticola]|uniref:Uncharacterized protein n=1 Tax=Methylobacterium crusticola TaxID=1697972 RepID=A0ABQ4QTB0_9HYPH|nr:hypothetical protein [Methylobacterium crusticola]GJD48296.1 hypothetical protein OPKNFCMD_1013 [Methylobacterium crusticola]
MASSDAAPRGDVRFSVLTAGPGALDLVVAFGARDYPVRLTPAEATELGLSLLATASVAADPGQAVPAGTTVENCFFPVLGWIAGRVAPEVPALALKIAEGTEMAFQFDRASALRCGRDLARSGREPLRTRLRQALSGLPGLRRRRAPDLDLAPPADLRGS